MQNIIRSSNFKARTHNRYWWHRIERCDYTPLIYDALSEDEWNLLLEWFDDTERSYQNTGEAGVPPLSLLIGLITGSGIDRIVQCGHYLGYSSLLLGFYMRKMGKLNSIYSIDIDASITTYSDFWLKKANLCDYVKLAVSDSADPNQAQLAINHLNGRPQLVFIDSSHQYEHTLKELDLWHENLVNGGLLALHDTSHFAKTFDKSGKGGVRRAVEEWALNKNVEKLNLNGYVTGGKPSDNIYLDGCGLTLLQKAI